MFFDNNGSKHFVVLHMPEETSAEKTENFLL